MVLADLGKKIVSALQKYTESHIINDELVDETLKQISNALISADVHLPLVINLRRNIKATIDANKDIQGFSIKKIIHKAVFQELCALLDPKVKQAEMKKNQKNIVMFIGMQGAGKTTSGTFNSLKIFEKTRFYWSYI
jgi:signal recognition particle subunit SRP54